MQLLLVVVVYMILSCFAQRLLFSHFIRYLLRASFSTTPDVTFEIWQGLFANTLVKVFTILAALSVMVHAWIGIWQVLSDYVKPAFLRGGLQFVFSVTLVVYFVTALLTVWGV